MIRVMVVDDHILIRKGILMLLEEFSDIEIAGEAGSGEEAILIANTCRPDVILMDISMPNGLDGFNAAEEILKNHSSIRIILLSMHDEEIYIQKAIQLNVSGFILKKSESNDLYTSISQVFHGKKYFSVGLPDKQIQKMMEKQGKVPSILTLREKEVVQLLVRGYSNKQIAEKLFISPKTVENHKANMMDKLQLSNKSELIQYGLNNMFTEPHSK